MLFCDSKEQLCGVVFLSAFGAVGRGKTTPVDLASCRWCRKCCRRPEEIVVGNSRLSRGNSSGELAVINETRGGAEERSKPRFAGVLFGISFDFYFIWKKYFHDTRTGPPPMVF